MDLFGRLFLQCFGLIVGIVVVFQICGKIFIKDIQEDFED